MVGRLLGLEIEMVVASSKSGNSGLVNRYFDAMANIKSARGLRAQPYFLNKSCVGIKTSLADCGLDNGFNLLETATAPHNGGLASLATFAHNEVSDSLYALKDDNLTILNASQHPDCPIDINWYDKVRVPRPIYNELVHYRKWKHNEGIDAKAQNGVNISVPVNKAIDALNVVVGLSAASIALFANSPLESGVATGLKENRLTIWPRVFGGSRFSGDLYLQQYPQRPFNSLADYFFWMFGNGTVTRSLPINTGEHYKDSANAYVHGNPCLYDFLHSSGSGAICASTGNEIFIKPNAEHFVYSQIAMFLDGRLRYQLKYKPTLQSILQAWHKQGALEQLFLDLGAECYIECRAPGANFADNKLLHMAGSSVASSVLIAPMALQLGVLRNLDKALSLVNKWGWQRLGVLRNTAIRYALADQDVVSLCTEVLNIALSGLDASDHKWLDYAAYNLQNRHCGADMFLDTWNHIKREGLSDDFLQLMLQNHTAIDPRLFTV